MEQEINIDRKFVSVMREFTEEYQLTQGQLITLLARAIATVTNWTRPSDD